MTDLILLTAGYRLDNLKSIAKSIVKNTRSYKDQLNVVWLICRDQYNAFGSMDGVEDYCFENDLTCLTVLTGKPNQPNYGGDSFNGPLFYLLEQRKDLLCTDDPWIYILDDDNILHPFIPDYLLSVDALDEPFEAIWLTKVRSTGIVDQAVEFSACCRMIVDNHWYILGQLCPDPSQIILRSHVVVDRGGYGAGFTYDYDWFVPVMEELKSTTYFFNYGLSNLDEIDAYHNGLRTKSELMEDIKLLDTSKLSTASVLLQYRDRLDSDPKARNYPISIELAKKIMNLIKEEMECEQ